MDRERASRPVSRDVTGEPELQLQPARQTLSQSESRWCSTAEDREKKHYDTTHDIDNRLDYLNNVTTAVVFVTTIINFFISTFGMQRTGHFPWLMIRIH
ncbi:hypothetical protein CRUP_038133 [Coryphaenoides rupestris]|nr:hypothetical protein CRUP_038133 [Coryphaenoides rupestris]